MHAMTDVPDSGITTNYSSPSTPDERQVLPIQHTSIWNKLLRAGCNTTVITWKRLYCSIRAVSHHSGKYSTCSSALLRR